MKNKRLFLAMTAFAITLMVMRSAVPWRLVTEDVSIDSIACYIEKGLLTHVDKYKTTDRQSPSLNNTVNYQVIQTSSSGQLSELLGEQINTVDSLVIHGPIDDSDLYTMWKASLHGNLNSINLENASIKDGRIPDMAFWHQEEQFEPGRDYIDCIRLKRIILPENTIEIGENAFSYAINLEYIKFPSSLRIIGEAAFSDCIRLNIDPLVFPEGMEKISDYLFSNCSDLKGAIILPSTIKEIGTGAFFQAKISSINFPESLGKIGDAAFYACRLKEVRLPESCQDISPNIFQLNLELESVYLPENIEYIPSSFAKACLKLSHIYIPSSVKHIGNYAFQQCESLQNIELPSNLESIGQNGLLGLKFIEEIRFPSTLKSLGVESCIDWMSVKQIYCEAKIPPLCEDSKSKPYMTPFGRYGADSSDCTLQNIPVYVPIGSADLYRNAWGWNFFTNFIETDFSGIQECMQDSDSSQKIIYDLFGRKVEQPLPNHLYIINGKKHIAR